ncbi:MAG: hypothetical protein M0R22_10940 [Dehalococcoidia bacterium]|nr:hypothetical protein [Dehalococcoidia bacterium]
MTPSRLLTWLGNAYLALYVPVASLWRRVWHQREWREYQAFMDTWLGRGDRC